jgi:predicted metal-binding protein
MYTMTLGKKFFCPYYLNKVGEFQAPITGMYSLYTMYTMTFGKKFFCPYYLNKVAEFQAAVEAYNRWVHHVYYDLGQKAPLLLLPQQSGRVPSSCESL